MYRHPPDLRPRIQGGLQSAKTDSKWKPKLKNYPHFDAPITSADAVALVTNPASVIKHKYLPFLTYTVTTKKIVLNRETRRPEIKKKERSIKYCAHKDACIYAYYRKLLLEKYEIILKEKGLSECVIAYRKILYDENGRLTGKSNINFAKESFDEIASRDNCIAIAIDITGFFESLEHSKLKEKWSRVLGGAPGLPKDHYKVFEHITQYETVDRDECFLRLGLMKFATIRNRTFRLFTYAKRRQPKQLCTMEEFREKIVGEGDQYERLIKQNPYIVEKQEYRGIPQGSPISDMLANMYMLDFDEHMKRFSDESGCYYRRYSDDILFICPADRSVAQQAINEVKSYIQLHEQYFEIKDSKTIITHFERCNGVLNYKSFDGDNQPKGNAFEYLGFSFDGRKALLKPQTLSRYYKKARHGIKQAVRIAFRRAKADKTNDVRKYLNMSDLFHKYGSPNRNIKTPDGKKSKNFISYGKRSGILMGDESIRRQLRNHKSFIRETIKEEIQKFESAE